MDTILGDLRIAVRQLAKSPGFALIAIVTLALGIGANTALFSLINSVLLRDPGYANPEQWADVYSKIGDFRFATSSNADYLDLGGQNRVFSGVLSYKLGSIGITRGNDETRSAWFETVSGNYFVVLGVRPHLGRLFDPAADDVVGGPSNAVLSYAYWKQDFGADPKIIGETLRLNGQPFTVIGVAAPNFRGMIRGLVSAVWTTSASFDRLFAGSNFRTDRNNRSSFLRARLKPGVTVEQAQANLTPIARHLAEVYPTSDRGLEFTVVSTNSVTFNPGVDGKITGAALALMVIPALVLLIACANLATLLLIRAVGRRREIAVRMALGAGRARVTRQLITESVLLAGLGGMAGLLLAGWFAKAVGTFRPPIPVPVDLDITLDGRVLGFTLVISVVTGILFGAAPAVRAGRLDLTADLREGARGATGRSRLRSVLVAGQLAVSVVLLVGAGLLLRSLSGAARVDLGFRPESSVTIQLDPSQRGYDREKIRQFFVAVRERARGLPGVEHVSYTSRLPLNLNFSTNEFVVEGRDLSPGQRPFNLQIATVGPDYFSTIGATIVAGRDVSDRDGADQPLALVINEPAAALLWPGQSAVGKRIAVHGSDGPGAWREVVGVVKSMKVVTVGESPTPEVFFPLYQRLESYATLVARVRGDPAVLIPAFRNLIREIDPAMPILATGTLDDVVSVALFPVRFGAMVLVTLGGVGLLIASIGLYGIIAHGVAQRTRELGVRMALGAQVRDVVGLVVRGGMRLVVVGLLAGIGLALLGGRLLGSWLYGISPYDPVALLAGPLVLVSVALVACWIPARRATRVNPTDALRGD